MIIEPDSVLEVHHLRPRPHVHTSTGAAVLLRELEDEHPHEKDHQERCSAVPREIHRQQHHPVPDVTDAQSADVEEIKQLKVPSAFDQHQVAPHERTQDLVRILHLHPRDHQRHHGRDDVQLIQRGKGFDGDARPTGQDQRLDGEEQHQRHVVEAVVERPSAPAGQHVHHPRHQHEGEHGPEFRVRKEDLTRVEVAVQAKQNDCDGQAGEDLEDALNRVFFQRFAARERHRALKVVVALFAVVETFRDLD